MANFDHLLEKIGEFGRYQKYHWFLLSLIMIPAGYQNLLNVYIMATPAHWCQGVNNHSDESSCWDNASEGITPGNSTTPSEPDLVRCTDWAYDLGPYGRTAVTEWDLVCTRRYLASLAQSLYMVGVLVGAGVLAYISDRYGRKIALFLGLTIMVVSGAASAYIPNYWVHVLLRLVVGMCSNTFAVAFVIYMEMMGVGRRMGPGVAAQWMFATGYMLLAGVAFLVRDSSRLNLLMSSLPALLLPFWWLVPESPRWLLSQGRLPEAETELSRAARMNKVMVDVKALLSEQDDLLQDESAAGGRKYSILDLLRTPRLRARTLFMMYTWLVTSMVYYGLSLGVTSLAGDPYLNLFISGVMEMSSVLATFFTIDRFGRRPCLAAVLVIGGAACLTGGLLPQRFAMVINVLSNIGKFGVSGSFCIIYVFTAEMYPTVVRTTAVGAGSMSARVGSLMSPFIVELRHVWAPFPYFIYGGCAVVAGIMCFTFPETAGRRLPDTVEEGELFGKSTSPLSACCSPNVAVTPGDEETASDKTAIRL